MGSRCFNTGSPARGSRRPGGVGWGGGRDAAEAGDRLIHIIIQRKPTQGCKAIILQLKKRKDKTGELGEVKCHAADSPAVRAKPEEAPTLKTLHLHQGGRPPATAPVLCCLQTFTGPLSLEVYLWTGNTAETLADPWSDRVLLLSPDPGSETKMLVIRQFKFRAIMHLK